MRYALLALLFVFGCDADVWKVPTGPDARSVVGSGEPCTTLWDCRPGLVCVQNRCESAPEDPCEPDYESCPTDASVARDASPVDALPADAMSTSSADATSALTADATSTSPADATSTSPAVARGSR